MKRELPSSAREALARQAAAEPHPSADLLSGFVEQALSAAEKERVTAHVAACSECREIVFLAGAAAAPELGAAPDRATRRPGWTIWQWAAPALAAVILVAGVVEWLHLPAKRPAMSQTAVLHAPPAPPAMQSRDMVAKVTPPSESLSAKTFPPPKSAPSSTKDITAEASAKKSSSAQPMPLQSNASALNDEAIRGKNEVAVSAASAPPPRPLGAIANAPSPAAEARTAPPASTAPLQRSADSGGVGGGSASEAAPGGAVNSAKAKASGGAVGGAFGSATLSLARRDALAGTHWRIADDGHLQHSSTSGEWVSVLAEQPVTFHAVAVVGSDVWAGGSDGALFHSTDGGQQWTAIALRAGDQTERGTLNSIRFDTPLQGRISGDSGATWSTADGGKSWTRQ